MRDKFKKAIKTTVLTKQVVSLLTPEQLQLFLNDGYKKCEDESLVKEETEIVPKTREEFINEIIEMGMSEHDLQGHIDKVIDWKIVGIFETLSKYEHYHSSDEMRVKADKLEINDTKHPLWIYLAE
ncbi:MAG: hypothetical protein ACRCX2_36280 [Paraclostridium sp.]